MHSMYILYECRHTLLHDDEVEQGEVGGHEQQGTDTAAVPGSVRRSLVGHITEQRSRYKKIRLTLLHDDKVEHREVGGNDAAADGLAAALALAAAEAAEARVAGGHQQLHAAGHQHSLLHAEALLVLPAHDLEDVPLVLLQSQTRVRSDQFRSDQIRLALFILPALDIEDAPLVLLHGQTQVRLVLEMKHNIWTCPPLVLVACDSALSHCTPAKWLRDTPGHNKRCLDMS